MVAEYFEKTLGSRLTEAGLPPVDRYYPVDADVDITVGENPVKRDMYWYHPDYIGNVDLITDGSGRVYQFFMYNAFGENLYQWTQSTGDYDSPYRFNGKELDPETGNYYYGARYYDPKISVWLSVDPLAHEYQNLSPYVFTGNNPIMLVDPDGMRIDDYLLDRKTGEITLLRETDDDFDVLYASDENGNANPTNLTVIEDRELLPQMAGENNTSYKNPTYGVDIDGRTGNTNNSADAEELFDFASKNSDVEWSLQDYVDGTSAVSTANDGSITTVGGFHPDNKGKVVQRDIHSHPGTTRDDLEPSSRDISRANQFIKINPMAQILLFIPNAPNSNARVYDFGNREWKTGYR